jgi:AraC-like DNA-binding protein
MSKKGRKPLPIDEKMLEQLTKLHLSVETIANCLGCSKDTLERRFAAKMELWRSQSKSKIANVLFDEAVNKREPWALKALAQKHLDYHDKVKTESVNTNMNYDNMTDEQLEQRLKELDGRRRNS